MPPSTPSVHATIRASGRRGGGTQPLHLKEREGSIRGEEEGEGRGGGNEGIGNADDASEKDATWSFVSFSLEKETKEP